MTTRRRGRRPFGSVRKLPSGRWQARYQGPDSRQYTARTEDGRPLTFTTKGAGDSYLARVRADIERGRWTSPDAPRRAEPPSLRDYSEAWLRDRPLATRTREHYAQLLRDHVLPGLGDVRVTAITPAAVRLWHAQLGTGPTAKAHAYSLLKAILTTAVADEVITSNPARVRAAGQAKRASRTLLPTLGELEAIIAATPPRYESMILLAAWGGLRLGELLALRRADVDIPAGVVHVRRGLVRTRSGPVVKLPKSEAGARDVALPPDIIGDLAKHLREHAEPYPDSLVFPSATGGYLATSTLYSWWRPAREAAGRPDLRFHDLRHLHGTMTQISGATLAETMARLGHSSVAAALRYQHAVQDRDKAIAEALPRRART